MSAKRSPTPVLDRAQTFPLSQSTAAPKNRQGEWMTAEVTPCSHVEEKRVCYPDLDSWRPQDGERHLSDDLEATVKGLRSEERFLGLKAEIRTKWSIKLEGAYRRIEGSNTASVPTIMVVAWDEDGREYSAKEEELWTQSCKDMVAFLRNHLSSYFGVEIVHWDMLDYRVVA
ncbi:hypothetical protein F4819DRAFT_462881 [Hypoxylon fuscum]|nr:hypothetical protein F4819DRAFT_462881 [Hypoxylon fuscum]